MRGEVLYYVHHHGDGHLARARAICARFAGPVTMLSSRPEPTDLSTWSPSPGRERRSWVRLPLDVWPGAAADAAYRDPDAGGRLHWAPLDQPGLQERNAAIAQVISRARPALLVADVSVEVAALARISGVQVVVVLLPGERTDPAHRLALDLATAVLAPWPRPRELPDWLRPWESKICFTGGVHGGGGRGGGAHGGEGHGGEGHGGRGHHAGGRRLGGRRGPAAPTVLVAFGAAGPPDSLPSSTAEWDWRPGGALPPRAWATQLADADVVVAHAGLGTVADLAAARARAVILPQARPFGEQHATGDMLRQWGIGPVVSHWPGAEEWPELLTQAMSSGTEAWACWGVENGAHRAAQLLADVAR